MPAPKTIPPHPSAAGRSRGRGTGPGRRGTGSDSGYILTLVLVLVFTTLVIGSLVGLAALRNGLFIRSQTLVIEDSAATPLVVGRASEFDLCDAPQVLCRDTGFTPADFTTPGPTEGLFALVGVRPDRLVSRDRIYYTGLDCTIPAGETAYIAPPAVASTTPALPVGYLNALEAVSYGVGAPATWPADMATFGPGLLYRSDGTTLETPAIQSVWTSLAPDCAAPGCVAGSTLAQLEAGSVTVGGTRMTVRLANDYCSPVVVATVQYANNTTPVVTRISNVTSGSFDIRLQNPSDGAVVADNVSYLVVEEGSWTIDGVAVDAQRYVSTVTDDGPGGGNWVGELQAYGQAFTSPAVVGQVMTENDPDWSHFWDRGASRLTPPTAAVLRTGKAVGEDTDNTRADETVGFVVFETAHGTIGGVEFEAALGAQTVQGVGNAPPYVYTFNSAFATAPAIAVASQAAMRGGNGAWAQVHGATLATTTSLFLSVDEDQIANAERNHITERVAYLAFAGPVVFPRICSNMTTTLSLLPAVEVVDSAGTNLIDVYTPPFTIQPPWITYTPAAVESAPLTDPSDPGATMAPGLPLSFPDPGPESDPPPDPEVPGAPGPGDPITTPPAEPEDG